MLCLSETYSYFFSVALCGDGHFCFLELWRLLFWNCYNHIFIFGIQTSTYVFFKILVLNSCAIVKCYVQFEMPLIRILNNFKSVKKNYLPSSPRARQTIHVVGSNRVFCKRSDVAPISFYRY